MGMGGTGGVPRSVVVMQAKGERDTLQKRVAVTQSSIKELEEALNFQSESSVSRIEKCLAALINVNLIQLKGNLKEGTERVDYLNEVIKQAESPVHRASLVHPASKQ